MDIIGDNAVTVTASTFSFDETSALEQTMVTVALTKRTKVRGIWIDMANVTQDTAVKVYHAIDGTNYREITVQANGGGVGTPLAWVTTDPDGVLLAGFVAYGSIRVTLTCGGGGAGSVNVPYVVV